MDKKSNVNNVIVICDVATANGGAANVAIQSAVGLSERGMNVVLFCAVGPIDQDLQKSKVKVICLNQNDILSENNRLKAMVQGIWNTKAYVQLDYLLQQYDEKDTVIHSHVLIKALSPSVWSVLSKYQFKVFVTLHDFFLFCPNGGMYNYKKQYICSLYASSFKCYRTNCDSRNFVHKIWRDVRQIVQSRVFSSIENLSFITISSLNKEICYPYLQRYSNKWYNLQNPIEMVSHDYVDIPHNDAYLFVGRLAKEKGPDLFCEAITQLGLRGIVVGDGYMKEDLQKQYPNIMFTGWLTGEDKYKIVRKCKCFVFASKWYETFGLVVAEMKAMGVPSIVPEESAAAGQIKDSYNGLYFKIGNLDSLIRTISIFEKADLRTIQKNVIESYNYDEYSLDTHIRKLIDIYNYS